MIPRLFCEFPSGLAAVSLGLQGGMDMRAPITRPGIKTGYREPIYGALGLEAGMGAQAYWWADADEDIVRLISCYPHAEVLREIAGIIRGWQSEDPRALWTRLRNERRARIASGQTGGAEAVAAYAMICASNRLISVGGPELKNTGKGGTTFGGKEFATSAPALADKFDAAAQIILDRWSFSSKGWRAGYGGPGCVVDTKRGNWTTEQRDRAIGIDKTARTIDGLSQVWPPVRVTSYIPSAHEVAEMLGTPGDLEDVIVYMDPPYLGTSGYLHSLSRGHVEGIALQFDQLGARVAISEAEPLPGLMVEGWFARDITDQRKGNARTFSAQQHEWLTGNRPFCRPAQASLWG